MSARASRRIRTLCAAAVAAAAIASRAAAQPQDCGPGAVLLGSYVRDNVRHLRCRHVRNMSDEEQLQLTDEALASLKEVDRSDVRQNRIRAALDIARRLVKQRIPYSQLDCSGFARRLFAFLPRTSQQQHDYMELGNGGCRESIRLPDMRPGDLMFFGEQHGRGSVEHVAVFVKRYPDRVLWLDSADNNSGDGPHWTVWITSRGEGQRGLWGQKKFMGAGRIGPN